MVRSSKRFMRTNCLPAVAIALLLDATLAQPFSATALTNAPVGLSATRSGGSLILSFPTTSTNFYGVQARGDLLQAWTNFQSGMQGDGTLKKITISNAFSAGQGFYQLLFQPSPTKLLLSQSDAFAILGYWCGGIEEQVYITGFNPTNGNPSGEVYLTTSCSTGRAGSPPAKHSAWADVTWDLAGNVISSSTLTNGAAANPTFTATDAYGDIIYNSGAAAYLIVPVPAMPTGVTAAQSGDQFQVSWTPNGVNPAAVRSSTLIATPVNSTNSTLTVTVAGSATTGVIALLQPQTTYQITVVNSTIGGPSPISTPIRVTTEVATVAPSAPTGLVANWTNLDPTGATDTLAVSWQVAVPGDSPIDQYQITISGSDGAGTSTQTVSGTTLTASFTVDYIPNWSVTVQAHNAVGWGPSSAVFRLGGL